MNKTSINLLSSEFKAYEERTIETWKAVFYCPKALSINFVFDQFWLPEGGKLFIYSANRKHLIGAFTSQNNKGSRKELRGFATGLVYGERVIMEYEQPMSVEEEALIRVSGVVHGYRYINNSNGTYSGTPGFGQSGNCQVNINCSEGNNWQNEKRGVAMFFVGSTRLCTGSLINSTSQNGDLLFLTANHCLYGRSASGNSNLDDFSFWWDYESPTCANPSSSPPGKITNGGTVLANNSNSDFALIRLSESPLSLNPAVEIYFNGWDRTNSQPIGGVGIHHPRLDIKKISTYNITPISNSNCSTSPSNYWEVNWNSTTNGFSVMQPGSSGSPLITSDRKIIGQLYGPQLCGNIQCDNSASQEVVYGRFSVSWTGGGANTNRLSNWLDPGNTGATNVNGGYFNNCPQQVLVNFPINFQGEFQAANKITANNTIASGANVSMKAGNSIELGVGFRANSGSNLQATIGTCTPKMVQPPSREAIQEDKVGFLETENSPLTLFPNPSSGKVTITLDIKEADKVVYQITNLMGQEVFRNEIFYSEKGNKSLEADLGTFSSGVYLVSVKGENFNYYRRIVKN